MKAAGGDSDRQSHRIGILGCGNIAGRYMRGLAQFPELEVVRTADVDVDRARRLAEEHGVRRFGDDADLYSDDTIDIVVTLTPPVHHADTILAALRAGKHVYVEKPLATTLEDARGIVGFAAEAGLKLGSAPDTFLGSACQSARGALDQRLIGDPVGAAIFTGHSKAERWHPDPGFLFREGGGPLLDMGPYAVAILVNLLGPVESLSGVARIGATTRRVTSPGRQVNEIDVEVPTHTVASMTLESGVLCTAQMSFDVWDSHLPHIEVYGTEGTLSLPAPYHFDGDVMIRRHDDEEWSAIPLVVDPLQGEDGQNTRGLGVRDLANAIEGGAHRASGTFALHVLDVLKSIEKSAQNGERVRLTTTCVRPEARANVW